MVLLRRSLSAILEDKAIQIPLEEQGQGVRVAHISDVAMLRTAGLVLAVHSPMPSELTRTRLPAQPKLGPNKLRLHLVQFHLPGIAALPIPHVPQPFPYPAPS